MQYTFLVGLLLKYMVGCPTIVKIWHRLIGGFGSMYIPRRRSGGKIGWIIFSQSCHSNHVQNYVLLWRNTLLQSLLELSYYAIKIYSQSRSTCTGILSLCGQSLNYRLRVKIFKTCKASKIEASIYYGAVVCLTVFRGIAEPFLTSGDRVCPQYLTQHPQQLWDIQTQ